jgi:hypothetical protein
MDGAPLVVVAILKEWLNVGVVQASVATVHDLLLKHGLGALVVVTVSADEQRHLVPLERALHVSDVIAPHALPPRIVHRMVCKHNDPRHAVSVPFGPLQVVLQPVPLPAYLVLAGEDDKVDGTVVKTEPKLVAVSLPMTPAV